MEYQKDKDGEFLLDDNGDKIPIENDSEKIDSLDKVKTYLDGQISEIKNLIQPAKELSSPDEFKLYHQQTENRMEKLNEKIDGFENRIDDFFNQFKVGNGGTFKSIITDFLFKP